MHHIIALAGNKASGKSTVADWLAAERGYVVRSFAGPLKELAQILFARYMTEAVCYGPSANRERPFSEQEVRGLIQCVRSGSKNLHWDPSLRDLLNTIFGPISTKAISDQFFAVFMQEPTKTLYSGRTILQILGTEWGRSLNENAWVNALSAELKPGSRYVVPDLRFPNEGTMLRAKGAGIYWVDAGARLPPRTDTHASEPTKEDLNFCLTGVIDNNGTPDELRAQLVKLF